MIESPHSNEIAISLNDDDMDNYEFDNRLTYLENEIEELRTLISDLYQSMVQVEEADIQGLETRDQEILNSLHRE
jgi:hypothetical protein